jgi:hypothetical protein
MATLVWRAWCLRLMGGSSRCKLGCLCGKHPGQKRRPAPIRKPRVPKLKYEDPRRGRCKAVEDGIRCERWIRVKPYCAMHGARMARHGTTDKLPPHKRGRPLSPLTAEHRRKQENAKKKQIKKEILEQSLPCMCGCKRIEHTKHVDNTDGRCTVIGCPCKKFTEVNGRLFTERKAKIINLGFGVHIYDKAVCNACNELVQIGGWLDPFVLRRAALHRTLECPKMREKTWRAS